MGSWESNLNNYYKKMKKNIILVIEDEPSISDNIEYALKTENFSPVCVDTGGKGLEEISNNEFALIILDVGLPDVNGFDLCRDIRKISDIPIIFLTARDAEIDRIVGLEIGADDYVTKPFSPRELTARIRAVLRRSRVGDAKKATQSHETAIIDVNTEIKEIRYRGEALSLSHYEYEVLLLLTTHPGKVFSRYEIMKEIWESPEMSMERTIDTHIKTIRRKMKSIQPNESPILTNRGAGYYLNPDLK